MRSVNREGEKALLIYNLEISNSRKQQSGRSAAW